jgi:hypothetical protein
MVPKYSRLLSMDNKQRTSADTITTSDYSSRRQKNAPIDKYSDYKVVIVY